MMLQSRLLLSTRLPHSHDAVQKSQRSALLVWIAGAGLACLGVSVFHFLRGTVLTGVILLALGAAAGGLLARRRSLSLRFLADVGVVALSLVLYTVTLYVSVGGSKGGLTALSLFLLVPLFMIIAALLGSRRYQWMVVAVGGLVATVIWLEILDLAAFRDSIGILRVTAYPAWPVMSALAHIVHASVRHVDGLTAKLYQNEARYRGIFDSGVDAYVVHDFDGTIIDVNGPGCSMYGYSRDEFIGKSVSMVAADDNGRKESLSRLRAGAIDHVSVETTHRRCDGSTFPVEVRVRTLDVSDTPVCVAVIRDLTDRRGRERRIAFQAQVLDTVSSVVIVVDAAGLIVYANRNAEAFAGFDAADLIGADLSTLFLPRSEQKRADGMLEAVLSNEIWTGELALRGPADEDVQALVTATPVLGPNGTVEHGIILAVDIAEQKDLERRLRDATAAAEQAARAKSSFLASMSHEIRTPLNGIIGFAEVLMEQYPRADQQEALSHLRAAGQSLLTILNDILDISKLESGKYELHAVDFDVSELLANIEALYGHGARSKDLAFTITRDRSVPLFLHADPDRLRQLLGNLVSNAVKYTDSGSVAVRLTADHESGDRLRMRIEVRDTGVGIAPADMPRLFTIFEQLHQPGRPRSPGTGLGLAICKRLVESMDGTIDVSSEPGVGSVFSCTVSVGWCDPDGGETREPVGVARSRPRGGRLRILVADDDRVSSLVAARLLQSVGHSVDLADGGSAAVESALGSRYDVIFMDMQMPELDGLQATAAIRREARWEPVIVGLSASALEDDRAAMLEAGMNLVVAKPVTKALLLDAIDEARSRGETASPQRGLYS